MSAFGLPLPLEPSLATDFAFFLAGPASSTATSTDPARSEHGHSLFAPIRVAIRQEASEVEELTLLGARKTDEDFRTKEANEFRFSRALAASRALRTAGWQANENPVQ